MKKGISLLLVLLLILSMLPMAFAAGIDSFDPVKELEKQSVWDYITEFGSLAVQGQKFYSPSDSEGEAYVVDVSYQYYYDPNTDNPAYVSEEKSDDYYYLTYIECKPSPLHGYYVYDMNTGENETGIEELDVDNLVTAWKNNVGAFDLSGARLRYSEEREGEYVFGYDVNGTNLVLYFDAESGWLKYSTEEESAEGYNVFTTLIYSPCNETGPERGYREFFAGIPGNSGSTETGGASSEKPAGKLSFRTKDLYGNDIDSSILAGKKLVLVNFWEPWCGWCLEEMPDMEKLYRKYKDQGLLFIGVYKRDEDVTDEEAREEIERMGITYPIIQDCADLQQFDSNGWPFTYVFDGDGNQIGDMVDGYQAEDAWEALIIQNLLR